MTRELIDRKQINYTMWEYPDGTFSDGVTLQSVIARMPTIDAVEVVRCDKCESHNKCRFEQYQGMDGFCSLGVRRGRMREILFRGKSIDDGEWLQGDLYHRNDEVLINNFQKGFNISVNPETIGQFTGLTDKNGKKIFEGDICKVGNLIYKVVFEYSCWWFKILSNRVYCCPAFNSHCGEHCEVIGNVHDNPERLGVTDND